MQLLHFAWKTASTPLTPMALSVSHWEVKSWLVMVNYIISLSTSRIFCAD